MERGAVDILYAFSNESAEMHLNYVGRSNDTPTDAVSFSKEDDFHWTIAEIMERCTQYQREKIANAFREMRIENFGIGYIYY